MKNQIHIVDVFAEGLYTGNPLAVVICYTEIDKHVMQLIAAEMNFSETAFLNPNQLSNGAFKVRMFTPSKELEFAGHPILGSADIIRTHLLQGNETSVQLKLQNGLVSVTFNTDNGIELVWFDAPPIEFGKVIEPKRIHSALGLDLKDIDTGLPIQQATAGTSAVIVPLKSLSALKKAQLDLQKYKPLLNDGMPPLVYLFTRETRIQQNDFSVRFFFDAHGVREDPATGNGAAFFGKYLLEYGFYPTNKTIVIEQGHELNRPSQIMLDVSGSNGSTTIKVGGRVIPVIEGTLL